MPLPRSFPRPPAAAAEAQPGHRFHSIPTVAQRLDVSEKSVRRPPSGFVQPPFLVTKENIHAEGGDQNTFIPSNDYKKHYLAIWGVK